MDILVTGGTGVATARLVHDQYPNAAIVLLCGARPDRWLLAEFARVAGFLPITCSPAAVVDIVRQAARGRKHFSPRVPRRAAGPRAASDRGIAAPLLSAREQELLQLMALGMTSKAIAEEMGLSASTARTYTQRLLEKLDTHSKIEAVGKAIRLGLIEP